MSDFCVFFPSRHSSQTPATSMPSVFSGLERILCDPLRAESVRSRVVHGAPVLLSQAFGKRPQFFARPDGSGWVVVKGIMANVRCETPAVNLEQLLQQVIDKEPGDLNRYEGVYAVAAWDAHKGQGWAFNDQVSSLNLYYGEYGGGLYVSTTGLALARVLGLRLDPCSVQEYLLRTCLLAPESMFAGLKRIDVGEHIRFRAGKLYKGAHWHPYAPRARYRSIEEAAEVTAALAIDRISRFGMIANPVVSDLTGGLDSRLLSSAADAAGLRVTVTVNGPSQSEDVRISHKIAEMMQWGIRYFDIQSLWADSITPEMRRELVYRTNGELAFTEIYHHLLSRPLLGQEFNLHIIGIGAELGGTHTWEGGLKMRYGSPVLEAPSAELFAYGNNSGFCSRLRSRIQAHSCQHLGALATQQWDTIWIWKMTGHASLYLSSVHNWLPSVAPMLGAGVVQTTMAMPARWRLASQLQRQAIACLAPQAAEIESWDSPQQECRGTAQPGLKTLTFDMYRYSRRLAKAVERRVLKKVLNRSPGRTVTLVTQGQVPVFTPEFRRFLDPETMYSRALYASEGLRHVLSGDETEWYSRIFQIVGLAQVEQLCRELDFQPEPNFWAPVLAPTA